MRVSAWLAERLRCAVRTPDAVDLPRLSLTIAEPETESIPERVPVDLSHRESAAGPEHGERAPDDLLYNVQTAQQEHPAVQMQALADQRLDYRDQLERSIQGFGEQLGIAARRMSDELDPDIRDELGDGDDDA